MEFEREREEVYINKKKRKGREKMEEMFCERERGEQKRTDCFRAVETAHNDTFLSRSHFVLAPNGRLASQILRTPILNITKINNFFFFF